MKFEYYVDSQSLTRVDFMIDLGVTLTTSMTSKNHILKMVSKAQCQVWSNVLWDLMWQ